MFNLSNNFNKPYNYSLKRINVDPDSPDSYRGRDDSDEEKMIFYVEIQDGCKCVLFAEGEKWVNMHGVVEGENTFNGINAFHLPKAKNEVELKVEVKKITSTIENISPCGRVT